MGAGDSSVYSQSRAEDIGRYAFLSPIFLFLLLLFRVCVCDGHAIPILLLAVFSEMADGHVWCASFYVCVCV